MHITQDMIAANKRKRELVPAIRAFLEKRLEGAPDEATRAKGAEIAAAFMQKAEAQPDEFYLDCKDICVAMKKLNAIK